jgi:hypothetical protein
LKTLRICLLVLLAVLLPVRGAVAAAMLCSPASMSGHSQAQAQGQMPSAEHAHHHESMMAAADEGPAHDHAGHHHDEGAAGGHHNGGSMEKCNLCCAFCTLAPMVSSLPSLPSPIDLSVISFPDLSAPSASFLSDGQERPPRST